MRCKAPRDPTVGLSAAGAAASGGGGDDSSAFAAPAQSAASLLLRAAGMCQAARRPPLPNGRARWRGPRWHAAGQSRGWAAESCARPPRRRVPGAPGCSAWCAHTPAARCVAPVTAPRRPALGRHPRLPLLPSAHPSWPHVRLSLESTPPPVKTRRLPRPLAGLPRCCRRRRRPLTHLPPDGVDSPPSGTCPTLTNPATASGRFDGLLPAAGPP